ncbi:uncharacterized protein LOC135494360 [Lineus longissimus]|uniref:uncharacterized protein LOC135494360 n=1 Tax=Lineus longissimus TaxID=88925 RepID=UPI00315C6912
MATIRILDSDRVVGVSLALASQRPVFFFMANLPSSNYPTNFYAEYVDYLFELCEFYSPTGEIVIMGDLNAQISGERTPSVASCQRTRALQSLLDRLILLSIPVSNLCSGPAYTFDPFEGSDKTLIDHICVSPVMLENAQCSKVIDEELLNTSDHLPVFTILKLFSNASYTLCSNPVRDSRKTLQWRRCLQGEFDKIVSYCQVLGQELSVIQVNGDPTSKEVDSLYCNITRAMSNAAEMTIPQRKSRKRCRPHWDNCLKSLHKNMRLARHEWLKAGKSGDPNSTERLQYKRHKRIFRVELRKLDAYLENEFYNSLSSAAEIDQGLFWKLLKRHRRQPPSAPPPMRFGGTTYYSSADISRKWAEYFENVFTPDTTGKYDETFKKHIEHTLETIEKDSADSAVHIPALDQPFTVDEIKAEIRTLKHDKACGIDGISNEQIKYGGHALHTLLASLFNSILKTPHVPKPAKQGVIHTLYKGKGKDKNAPQGYRPITLLSSV